MGIEKVVLASHDTSATALFIKTLGLEERIEVRAATSTTPGFRGFTLSLVCSQPANVDALVEAALAAGATTLQPARKSFWGYGAILQDAEGTVWKFAASSKKNTGPARAEFDDVVLLLGVADVKASKQFYVERGLEVAKSFGGKYAEFATGPITLALYPRKAAAKECGLPVEPAGEHRLAVRGSSGEFGDLDGFAWENA